jgi:cell division septal protein FtsQ
MTTRSRAGRRSLRRTGMSYDDHASVRSSPMRVAPFIQRLPIARVLAVLTVLLIFYGIYTAFTADALFVYESDVTVKGNVVVSEAEIFAVSGLDGMSVFWVNPDVVAERLTSLSNVKSAEVKVSLPSNVRISVEERRPALVWQTGDVSWWVDAEGTIIEPRSDLPDALVVVDTDSRPVEPGQQLDPAVLSAIRALRLLLPDLSQMRYSRESGVGFMTREGWPVFLGLGGEDMEAKLRVLVALRRHFIAQGAAPEFINLEYVESPYYR